jgi:hypothetical protein
MNELEAHEDAINFAEAGVKAMISALREQNVPADAIVNAALHILAAWEASRDASFTAAERETCIQELMEMLPSHIDKSRAATWLPDTLDM